MTARLCAVVLAAAALCGCGGTRVNPETPAGVNLAGTWKLDAQASQNPQAMIDRIHQDFLKRMRRYGPQMDESELPDISPEPTGPERGAGRHAGAPSSGSQRSDQRVRASRMQRASYEVALGPQLHVEGLTIEQSATRVVFIRGSWRRSFTPGGQSVVSVADGVADQRSGWSGRDYVIEVRPQVGPRVIERYGLSADNRQLVEKFTLTEEGLPKLEFTRVYVRGTPAERALPTSN